MADFQRQVQLQFPSPTKLLTPAITTILILMVIGFALINYASDFTFRNLAVSQSCLFGGKIWQLVTYSFVNGGCGLLFNAMIILFFGSAIEREWRTRATIFLALSVIVVCALLWFLVGLVMRVDYVGFGSSSLAFGFVGTFGLLFRKQRFWALLWTLEGQTLACILIIIGLVYSIANPISLVWVSGALVAYLYIKVRWLLLANRSIDGRTEVRTSGFVDLD